MTAKSSVVVVGAGTTGLALACGLVEAGVPVRVLDKAAGPAVTSRALGLQPRGVEVLDRLGALRDLPDQSLAIAGVAVHINGQHVTTLQVGRRTTLVTRPGLLVSQAVIEAALRARLSDFGVQVEWGREVVGAEQDAGGVSVEVTGTPGSHPQATGELASTPAPSEPGVGSTPSGRPSVQVLHAGWLVGCDGAHSRIRKQAGIDFPGVPLIERFLLADVRADLPIPREGVTVWLRGEQMFGAFPLPGTDTWRLMAPVAPLAVDAPTRSPAEDVLGTLTALLQEHSGCPASVVREAVWTSTFRVHRRLARTYRRGRILLAGDAAHIHSPLGGQGMNTGLGDAENLAWKLALVARGRASEALLSTYEAERRPIATEVLRSTSSMTRMVLGDSTAARWIRDHVFVPLMGLSVVQRLIWEQASQLRTSYHRGPLGGTGGRGAWFGQRGPRPGDRVPDLACRHRDGRTTRLYAELGGGWALVIPASPGANACGDAVVDRLGEAAVTLLEPLDVHARHAMLVRPDGHLAWRGEPAAAQLDTWLARTLHTGRP